MVRLTTLKPRLQPPQGGRKLATAGGSWRDGKTTNERGYTYAWQKARERFLRDNPLCCYCARDGQVTAATVVDHKVPHNGDQQLFWNEENWQPMCKPHHDAEKQREERGQVSGR